jgi:hypothetical protein
MAKQSAKGAVIQITDSTGGAQTISGDVLTYDITYANDTPEVTGFGDGSHNFIPGQKIRAVTLECLFNPASSSDSYWIFKGLYETGATTELIITPESGQNMKGNFILTDMQLSGAPGGDAIKIGSCNFAVSGATAPDWTTT